MILGLKGKSVAKSIPLLDVLEVESHRGSHNGEFADLSHNALVLHASHKLAIELLE